MKTSLTPNLQHVPAPSRSLIRWAPLFFALGIVSAARSQEGDELRLTFSVQATTEVVPTVDPACPLKLVIEGAGLTNLLGPVLDNASHCIEANGLADHGHFTFTGPPRVAPGGGDSEDSISGQYVAHLVPTVSSVPPTPTSPARGYWLVYEEFCISNGTGKYARIANDCPMSTNPGRSFTARGSVDLDTGQANIYGSAIVHWTWE